MCLWLTYRLCESLPIEKGNNHNEVCIVGWGERVRSGGGTLHCGYFPDSPKMWPACRVTSSGDYNGFRKQVNGLIRRARNDWLSSYRIRFWGVPYHSGKDTKQGCRPETWCTDAVQLCQSEIVQQLNTFGASCFLHPKSRKWLSLGIADTSAIPKDNFFRRDKSLSRRFWRAIVRSKVKKNHLFCLFSIRCR